MPNSLIPPPSTIALLQLCRLGDAILTTPLFAALKQCYPDSRLTVIASRVSAIIPQNHPAVDEVIALPGGMRQLPLLAAKLRRRRFDLYIDPKDHRSTTSRLIADLLRARMLITHPPNYHRRKKLLPLPPAEPSGHYVDRMLAPMKMLAT